MLWRVLIILHLNLAVLGFAFAGSASPAPQCGGTSSEAMSRRVEKINERYDDFFRFQRAQEEREVARDKGRGENRRYLQTRQLEQEKARLDYIKHRRPPPDTADAERQAEREQKARLARIEEARRCYVTEREHVESTMKRGRIIPENKEYDLED